MARYISRRSLKRRAWLKRKQHNLLINLLRVSSFLSLLTVLAVLFLANKIDFPFKQARSQQAVLGTNLQLSTPAPTAAPSVSTQPTPSPKPKLAIPTNSGRMVHVLILYYHYIGNNPNPKDKLRDDLSVTPDKFEAQMNYLSSHNYNSITFDQLYSALKGKASLPDKPVILTFDDGYIDFYVNAYPILKKYNLHATSFIPTGKVGTTYYLYWDQIKEMDASGLISFQAHTVDHVNLLSLSDAKLRYQIFESKKVLEQQLGKKVNFMAYPYGTADERVWTVVKEAGFVGAAGTWFGSIESEGNLFDMPRIKISGKITLKQFQQKVH